MIAALELEYAMELPAFPIPAMDAVFTMQPFVCLNAAVAILEHLKGPITLVCMICCQRSSVIKSKFSKGIGSVVAAVPALLIKTSKPPRPSIAADTILSALSAQDMSPGALKA